MIIFSLIFIFFTKTYTVGKKELIVYNIKHLGTEQYALKYQGREFFKNTIKHSGIKLK